MQSEGFKFFKNIFGMVYPKYCIGCEVAVSDLVDFCVECQSQIRFTDHFEVKDNDLLYRLMGRVTVIHGAALYYFIKGGRVQQAIHALKYSDRPDIGLSLGRQFGQRINQSSIFPKPDYIIPIPIHYKKLQGDRGYNQCTKLAQGIAGEVGAIVDDSILVKHKELDSQTRKSRMDRFENVLNSFTLQHGHRLEDKQVLLVDDVMTTGATLEAACTILSAIPRIKLSLGIIVLADG